MRALTEKELELVTGGIATMPASMIVSQAFDDAFDVAHRGDSGHAIGGYAMASSSGGQTPAAPLSSIFDDGSVPVPIAGSGAPIPDLAAQLLPADAPNVDVQVSAASEHPFAHADRWALNAR